MINTKTFTRIAGLAVILTFSPAVLAGHHHGGMHGEYYENLTVKLDLNAQQQQLLATSREQMMAEKQKKRQLRQQLKSLVHSDSYDAAAVELIADQIAAATREQIIQHGATMNEFYRSLNPEQRSTLQDIEQQRGTKMKAQVPGAK
jgi:Spy/CpxP family protein refolding chaperone